MGGRVGRRSLDTVDGIDSVDAADMGKAAHVLGLLASQISSVWAAFFEVNHEA